MTRRYVDTGGQKDDLIRLGSGELARVMWFESGLCSTHVVAVKQTDGAVCRVPIDSVKLVKRAPKKLGGAVPVLLLALLLAGCGKENRCADAPDVCHPACGACRPGR